MPTHLKSRLPEIEKELPRKVMRAVERGAEQIATSAATRAPKDTGALARSIEAKHGDEGFGVYAIWRWFFTEFGIAGTRRRPPQPFMIPALEANRESFQAEVEQALRDL